jgi:hypothetical protein
LNGAPHCDVLDGCVRGDGDVVARHVVNVAGEPDLSEAVEAGMWIIHQGPSPVTVIPTPSCETLEFRLELRHRPDVGSLDRIECTYCAAETARRQVPAVLPSGKLLGTTSRPSAASANQEIQRFVKLSTARPISAVNGLATLSKFAPV